MPEHAPQSDPASVMVRRGVFSDEECDAIVALVSSLEGQAGEVWSEGGYQRDDEARRVSVFRLPVDQGTEWIYERISSGFATAARRMGFEVSGLSEPIRVMRYALGGHYGLWHADVGPGPAALRKISVSVELSRSTDFAGGKLEIFPADRYATGNSTQGDGVFFPSFLFHRVTPVTRGTRYALVNWASGPRFR